MEGKGGAIEYQYTALAGIGSAAVPAVNGPSSTPQTEDQARQGGQEEAFIPLLDVVEDTGDGVIKPTATAEAAPTHFIPEGGISAEGEPTSSGRRELPWARSSRQIKSPSLRLHNEIVEFCRFLEPTADETFARHDAISRITAIVRSIFPLASVQVFGSFVTGLYLPTSDMDLVVINSGCDDIPRALKAIGNALVDQGMAKNIQVIAKASVPIIKFDDLSSGLPFDISFNVANGPKTAKFVLGLMKSLPPMRQLVMVLKLFLQQRELNEVYQGGIGSFALNVMVAAFLLQHPSRQPTKRNTKPPLEGNIGILLLDFFRLYGRTLNAENVIVSCRGGGAFLRKRDKGLSHFLQRDRAFLAVEDPQDTLNNLAKGSYNIRRVQQAFDLAYQQLSSPVDPADSLLERIVRLDAVLVTRVPTNKMAAGDSDMDLDSDLETQKQHLREKRKLAKKEKQARKRAKQEREQEKALRSAKRVRERDREFGDASEPGYQEREAQPRSKKRHKGSHKHALPACSQS